MSEETIEPAPNPGAQPTAISCTKCAGSGTLPIYGLPPDERTGQYPVETCSDCERHALETIKAAQPAAQGLSAEGDVAERIGLLGYRHCGCIMAVDVSDHPKRREIEQSGLRVEQMSRADTVDRYNNREPKSCPHKGVNLPAAPAPGKLAADIRAIPWTLPKKTDKIRPPVSVVLSPNSQTGFRVGLEAAAELASAADARIAELERALYAAKSLLWMAERYAEAGGTGGPEMRDYDDAMEIINQAALRQPGEKV